MVLGREQLAKNLLALFILLAKCTKEEVQSNSPGWLEVVSVQESTIEPEIVT